MSATRTMHCYRPPFSRTIRALATSLLMLLISLVTTPDFAAAGSTANGVRQNQPYVFPPYIDADQSPIPKFELEDGPLMTLWKQGITDARDRRFVLEWPSGKLLNIQYSFKPKDYITREQFYAMLARAFQLEPVYDQSPFSDYSPSVAAKNYAEWFVDTGAPSLIQATIKASGTGALSLLAIQREPYGPVWRSVWQKGIQTLNDTRFTVNLPPNTKAVILFRNSTTQSVNGEIETIVEEGGNVRNVNAKIGSGQDNTGIVGPEDETYYPWVMAAVKEGFVTTTGGNFNPSARITYAEILQALVRAMGYEPFAQSLDSVLLNRFGDWRHTLPPSVQRALAVWRMVVEIYDWRITALAFLGDVGASGLNDFAKRDLAATFIYNATRAFREIKIEWASDNALKFTAIPRWFWIPVKGFWRVVGGRYVPYEAFYAVNEFIIYYVYPRTQDGYGAGSVRKIISEQYPFPGATKDGVVWSWTPIVDDYGSRLNLPEDGLFLVGLRRSGLYDPYHFPEPPEYGTDTYEAWTAVSATDGQDIRLNGYVWAEKSSRSGYFRRQCEPPLPNSAECPAANFVPFRLIKRSLNAGLTPQTARLGQTVTIFGVTERPVAQIVVDVPTVDGDWKRIRLSRVWLGSGSERWEGTWAVPVGLQPGTYELTVTAYYADAAVPQSVKVTVNVVQPPPIKPNCDAERDPTWAHPGQTVSVGCIDTTQGGRVIGGTVSVDGGGSYALRNVSGNLWSAEVRAPASEGVYRMVLDLMAEDEAGMQYAFQEYQMLVVAPPGSTPPGAGAPGGGIEVEERTGQRAGRIRLTR